MALLFEKETYLLDRLIRLQCDVRNIGIHHEREQVQDQIGVSEEMEGRRTFYLNGSARATVL